MDGLPPAGYRPPFRRLLPAVAICLALGGPFAWTDAPAPAEIERLVRQLGSRKFAEREAAAKALAVIGAPAFRALRAAAEDGDGEVRARAEKLLAAIVRGLERRRLDGHTDQVNQLALSRDGKYALSGSQDRTLRLWDVRTGKEVRRFEGHTGGVWGVAFSPDGRRALSGGGGLSRGDAWQGDADSTVRLWDVETGKEIRRFVGHKDQVLSVAFSPDGRHAVSGGLDQIIRLWDVETGRELRRLEGHQSMVMSVAFSPDGRHVLSANWDGTLRLWDADDGKEVRRFTGHDGWVMAGVFSPDGRRALSAGADATVRLWDVRTGKELRRFKGHTTMALRVAFSPDGKLALSGAGCRMLNPHRYVPAGGDYTVRLWDVESGKELCRLDDHTGPVLGLAFTPDGRRALSCSGDTTLRVWGLPK